MKVTRISDTETTLTIDYDDVLALMGALSSTQASGETQMRVNLLLVNFGAIMLQMEAEQARWAAMIEEAERGGYLGQDETLRFIRNIIREGEGEQDDLAGL